MPTSTKIRDGVALLVIGILAALLPTVIDSSTSRLAYNASWLVAVVCILAGGAMLLYYGIVGSNPPEEG